MTSGYVCIGICDGFSADQHGLRSKRHTEEQRKQGVIHGSLSMVYRSPLKVYVYNFRGAYVGAYVAPATAAI